MAQDGVAAALLAEALAAARAIPRPYLRAMMLLALAKSLSEPLAPQALADALDLPPPSSTQERRHKQ